MSSCEDKCLMRQYQMCVSESWPVIQTITLKKKQEGLRGLKRLL